MYFSMICCFDNENIVSQYFKSSLQEQQFKDFEVILLQDKGQLQGAGPFLNQAALNAHGDYLVFCHADLVFPPDFLSELHDTIQKIPSFGISGFAGCKRGKNNTVVYSNILHGPNHIPAGKSFTIPIYDGQTVDECCFVVPKKSFHSFANIGPTWHLYSVNYCLECLSKGETVFILPLKLFHESQGASFSNSYFRSLSIVRKRFSKSESYINTTIGSWPTNFFLYFFNTEKRKLFLWISKFKKR